MTSHPGTESTAGSASFAVTRLRYNGSQDPTFAGYKLAVSPAVAAGGTFAVGGVALDAAGDIVVDADRTGTYDQGFPSGYVAARFTSAGGDRRHLRRGRRRRRHPVPPPRPARPNPATPR